VREREPETKSAGVSGMGIGFQRSWLGLHFKCEKDAITPPERERARESARERARARQRESVRERGRERETEKECFQVWDSSVADWTRREGGGSRDRGGSREKGGKAICRVPGAQIRGDLRRDAGGIARCADCMCARR
jgi:hypothetical protein